MSNKTGAWLARYALEQLPIKHTFGIPGVHNTELYDELNKSDQVEPVLVTHEAGGAFMADAISRTSDFVGALLIVPAAGVTHALSGIGEAFLDGIPMLIISGGTRTDIDKQYQLHQMDQVALLKHITKGAWKVSSHNEIVSTIFKAYDAAVTGEPGPVFVEIPVNLQLFKGPVEELPEYHPKQVAPEIPSGSDQLREAVRMLKSARKPGLFLGWGAARATDSAVKIAELLGAPVATTLQGLSVFPGNHELHTGMGFGPAAVPAARNAFKGVDCLLAVGVRFGEIPTGSFGTEVPENLIHLDINPEVFHKNYPARLTMEADAAQALPLLAEELERELQGKKAVNKPLTEQIARDKKAYLEEWLDHKNERVNPARFFQSLRREFPDDGICVVDDGNHTFLAAELFQIRESRRFISPTDFNCMGYCVPAAIGAKLVNPDKTVIGIVGDGAFLMTGLEILTATSLGLGVVYFVFYDGELSQISQGQEIPYNRKTCTVLGNVRLKGVADATGAAFLEILDNDQVDTVTKDAFSIAQQGQPVIVDVRIDYSKRTAFTQGVVGTVLKRFPLGDKFRFIGRALWRKITG